MNSKTDLRTKFKALRKELDIKFLSSLLTEKIRKSDIYINSQNIMIFYPTKYEIDVRRLCDDTDKNFYLPKVDNKNLLVCPYNCCDTLKKSEFNIYEPCSNPVSANILDLIIVPALCVDKNNYRLGYGGGFYDRFISQNPKIKTIVPVPKCMMVDKLPLENYDKKVDFVITD